MNKITVDIDILKDIAKDLSKKTSLMENIFENKCMSALQRCKDCIDTCGVNFDEMYKKLYLTYSNVINQLFILVNFIRTDVIENYNNAIYNISKRMSNNVNNEIISILENEKYLK